MNYLGIDYGREHIGVAIATGPLAEPLTTVSFSFAESQIPELLKENSISEIVVGLPDESWRAEIADFINRINPENLPIHYADETLSSQDATSALLHTTQSRRQARQHSTAAALILQHWLDENVSSF